MKKSRDKGDDWMTNIFFNKENQKDTPEVKYDLVDKKVTGNISFKTQTSRNRTTDSFDPTERHPNLEYKRKDDNFDYISTKKRETNFEKATSRESHFMSKVYPSSFFSPKFRNINKKSKFKNVPHKYEQLSQPSSLLYNKDKQKVDNFIVKDTHDFSKTGREEPICWVATPFQGGTAHGILCYDYKIKSNPKGFVNLGKKISQSCLDKKSLKEKTRLVNLDYYDGMITAENKKNKKIKSVNMEKTSSRGTYEKVDQLKKTKCKTEFDIDYKKMDNFKRKKICSPNLMHSIGDGCNKKKSVKDQIASADMLLKHVNSALIKLNKI